MEAVQKGFEQYYAQNSSYDAVNGCTTMGGSTTYFPAGLPRDPRNSSPYTYSFYCTASAYCACARLEGTSTGNSTGAASTSSCSFATSGALNYHCVSNMQ